MEFLHEINLILNFPLCRWDKDHLWLKSQFALYCWWLATGVNYMDPTQWPGFEQTSNHWTDIFSCQWDPPTQAGRYLWQRNIHLQSFQLLWLINTILSSCSNGFSTTYHQYANLDYKSKPGINSEIKLCCNWYSQAWYFMDIAWTHNAVSTQPVHSRGRDPHDGRG